MIANISVASYISITIDYARYDEDLTRVIKRVLGDVKHSLHIKLERKA
jgi:hypothetical protein